MNYLNFKPKNGLILIKTDDDIEREILGTTLDLVRGIESEDDMLRMQHKKIYGIVVDPGEGVDHDWLYNVDPGYPLPTPFRGPVFVKDAIEIDAKNFNRVRTAENDRKLTSQLYRPGTYEPEVIYTDDVQENILRAGDKVYFHYQTLENNGRLMFRKGNESYWMVPYSRLLCVVKYGLQIDVGEIPIENIEEFLTQWNKTGTMIYKASDDPVSPVEELPPVLVPVNAYVLVEPYWGKEYKELSVDGHIIQAQTKMVGDIELVVGFADEPEYLTGILRYVGKPMEHHGRNLPPSTKVIFRPDSEFSNVIEGEEFWLMHQWDIMAAFINDQVVPVGDYVKIALIEEEDESDFLIIEKKKPRTGIVEAHGDDCGEHFPLGSTVLFDESYIEFKDFALIKYSHIAGRFSSK